MGSIPREHILIQKCIAWMHCKSLWIKASAKCNLLVFCFDPSPNKHPKRFKGEFVLKNFRLVVSENKTNKKCILFKLIVLFKYICIKVLDEKLDCGCLKHTHTHKKRSFFFRSFCFQHFPLKCFFIYVLGASACVCVSCHQARIKNNLFRGTCIKISLDLYCRQKNFIYVKKMFV